MSARAMKQKAAGAIVNGYSKDTSGILKLSFPTFSEKVVANAKENGMTASAAFEKYGVM